jgi:hypothetical protein
MNDSEIQLWINLREEQQNLQHAYSIKQFLIDLNEKSTNPSIEFGNKMQLLFKSQIMEYNKNEEEWLSYFVMKAIINKDVTGVSYIYGNSIMKNACRKMELLYFLIIIIVCIIFGLLS